MTNAYQDLIYLWRSFTTEISPYIALQDKHLLNTTPNSIYYSFRDYVRSNIFGDNNDQTLHLGLLPTPFIGNINEATVFILMLNPGLDPRDYWAEYHHDTFRKRHIQNLLQRNPESYPFHFLDPQFAWHSGFEYWHRKLRHLVSEIKNRKNISYSKALEFLSRKIACLELCPYHSKSFGSGSLINKLPSAKIMQAYVKDFLLEKARKGYITIIVTRGARNWDLPNGSNVIIYGSSEARSAHLTLNSSGGKAIAKQLGI